jgi:hypothetical protein
MDHKSIKVAALVALRTSSLRPKTNHARTILAHYVEKWLVPLIENNGDKWQCLLGYALLHAEIIGSFLLCSPRKVLIIFHIITHSSMCQPFSSTSYYFPVYFPDGNLHFLAFSPVFHDIVGIWSLLFTCHLDPQQGLSLCCR